ncbi:LytTR family DNA-binding domain-containing protein [Limibacter armeniacum]|uniref:LytR/AlgR family response regulator transcription factor n=1 Tax=Limibacter armeniacum TaxID=466084 RepID=UPI002FE64BE4
MISVLIVEDEALSARKLEKLLHEVEPDFSVVKVTDSISSTVDFLTNEEVDLIFLDIHLADGNSFEIFKRIEVATPIIFTTAFDQYAIEAFQQNSIDYLLKPIALPELEKSIKKYFRFHSPVTVDKSESIDYQKLGQIVLNQLVPEYKERFMVFVRDQIKSIKAEEIAYFFAESKAVFFTTFGGKTYDTSYTLDQLEKELNPKLFFRANRKYIIQMEAISEVVQYSRSRLKVNTKPESQMEIIIPLERTSKFKQWLNQ